MLLIAHRGNISGPNPEKENHPDYLFDAMRRGYHVEVDVWYLDKKWYLGHDSPQYNIDFDTMLELLCDQTIWHAKNSEALEQLVHDEIALHYFWHNIDDYTLTSERIPWVYPGKRLFPGAIAVLPERGYVGELHYCHGICSDYIERYADCFPY